MMKAIAKVLGYKVIDEFDSDIASRVYLELDGDKVMKVIDEFGVNVSSTVEVVKC